MARAALPFPKQKSYVELLFGGRWLWIHRCNTKGKYVPLLSVALCILLVVCFCVFPGAWDQQSSRTQYEFTFRGDDPALNWYTVLFAAVSQVGAWHLFFNVTTLLVGGVFLELTEGSVRLALVVWGAQTLSMGVHGAMDGRSIVGSSGVGLGLLWAQLALLALKWQDMPLKLVRVVMLCAMGMFDAGSVYSLGGMRERAAMWAHLGGALAAISVALITGVNVRRRHWEWMLSCVGVLIYASLVVWVIALEEKSAGLLAACLLPFLIIWAMYDLRPTRADFSASREAEAQDAPAESVDFGDEIVQEVV